MYTLGDIPRKSAILFPNNTATVFEGARLTYRQLNERVNRLANALLGLGVAKGDRLTILAENTHKYLEVYFAAAKIGLSATPLNFRLSDQELLHIVNDSDATCFFVGDGYEDRARKMKDSAAAISTGSPWTVPWRGIIATKSYWRALLPRNRTGNRMSKRWPFSCTPEGQRERPRA